MECTLRQHIYKIPQPSSLFPFISIRSGCPEKMRILRGISIRKDSTRISVRSREVRLLSSLLDRWSLSYGRIPVVHACGSEKLLYVEVWRWKETRLYHTSKTNRDRYSDNVDLKSKRQSLKPMGAHIPPTYLKDKEPCSTFERGMKVLLSSSSSESVADNRIFVGR